MKVNRKQLQESKKYSYDFKDGAAISCGGAISCAPHSVTANVTNKHKRSITV